LNRPILRPGGQNEIARNALSLCSTTGIESFLAILAALHLDGQDRVQDALLNLVDENINDGYGNGTFF
jgi:hypothetical protein